MTMTKLHMDGNCINDPRFDRAIARIAKCYEVEDYDGYEHFIEYYANKFDLSENFVEDAAMDLYYYGPNVG